MAYTGKTNWQLNEIVKPEDMNRIEQGVIDAHENLLTHKTDTNSHTDIRNKFNEFVKGVTGSNATLTITKGNGTTSMVTVNNVANATNATNASKATQDSTGQQINSTYIKGLSVSGKTITYTKGNNTTGTITTQDTTYNFGGTTFYSGNENTAEHDANNCLKNGHYYYTSNGPSISVGASTSDGGLYTQSYSDIWVGQIAQDYRNGKLFVRGKNNGKWTSWLTLLDSSNYNNYAPTKTGGGASGTWGINISGNADTATSATNADTAQVANKVNFTIGDEIVFNRNGQKNGGDVWIGYRNEGATSPITAYQFGDGLAHGALANIRAKTFVGNLSGNADTATNADKLDGYHVADLLSRITAANTGIVAASHTDNGYVKFANGFMIQWGNSGENTYGNDQKVYYPIAFTSKVFYIGLSDTEGYNFFGTNRSKSTLTYFVTWGRGIISAHWVAMGV